MREGVLKMHALMLSSSADDGRVVARVGIFLVYFSGRVEFLV